MVYLAKRGFRYHTAVVITPSPQYGVEVFYQFLLRYSLVSLEHDLVQFLGEPFLTLRGWFD